MNGIMKRQTSETMSNDIINTNRSHIPKLQRQSKTNTYINI